MPRECSKGSHSVVSDPGPGHAPKRLGVLGTLVQDTIHLPSHVQTPASPARTWGGIAYALAALEHELPVGWTMVPLVKVGRDIASPAMSFLRSFNHVGDLGSAHLTPAANNRVELTYRTESERVEVLSGGVPGWTPDEMGDVVPTLDALYANFISGIEIDLAGAEYVRDHLDGPTYADLHSLFLGIADDGRRTPRYLPSGERWVGCFDTVQMNENEFELFVHGALDCWREAEKAMTGRVTTIVVTRGAAGVEFVTRGHGGPPLREHVPVAGGPAPGDPTGCGDIWGATFFAGLLGGAAAGDAARRANAMARRKLGFSGAEAFRSGVSRQIRRGGG